MACSSAGSTSRRPPSSPLGVAPRSPPPPRCARALRGVCVAPRGLRQVGACAPARAARGRQGRPQPNNTHHEPERAQLVQQQRAAAAAAAAAVDAADEARQQARPAPRRRAGASAAAGALGGAALLAVGDVADAVGGRGRARAAAARAPARAPPLAPAGLHHAHRRERQCRTGELRQQAHQPPGAREAHCRLTGGRGCPGAAGGAVRDRTCEQARRQ